MKKVIEYYFFGLFRDLDDLTNNYRNSSKIVLLNQRLQKKK
jgi:hypothetical protein